AADPPILDIHKNVRSRLHLGDPLNVRVDIVGTGACAAYDFDIVAMTQKQVARLERSRPRALRVRATVLEPGRMGYVSSIGAQALWLEILRPSDSFGQSQCGFHGLNSSAVLADIEIDQNGDANSDSRGRAF